MIRYDPTASEGPSVLPAVLSLRASPKRHHAWIGMRSLSRGLDQDCVVDGGARHGRRCPIRPSADFRKVRPGARGRGARGNEEVMSMDRLRRVLAGGMLAIMLGTVVAASGCRNLRNEVPPGPKYSTTGEPSSSVGFNSAPHPYVGTGSPYANGPIPGQPSMPGSAGLGGARRTGCRRSWDRVVLRPRSALHRPARPAWVTRRTTPTGPPGLPPAMARAASRVVRPQGAADCRAVPSPLT